MAWLQLESIDSGPARFWTYLIEAVGQAQPQLRDGLNRIVAGSNGDGHVVVSALVSNLALLAEPLIIVIDDYHLIENTSVHVNVERLIDLGPPNVTIVLSTRFDPPFRLGRLRVRNHLVEIRGDDLRFDPAEATDLLRVDTDIVDGALVATRMSTPHRRGPPKCPPPG